MLDSLATPAFLGEAAAQQVLFRLCFLLAAESRVGSTWGPACPGRLSLGRSSPIRLTRTEPSGSAAAGVESSSPGWEGLESVCPGDRGRPPSRAGADSSRVSTGPASRAPWSLCAAWVSTPLGVGGGTGHRGHEGGPGARPKPLRLRVSLWSVPASSLGPCSCERWAWRRPSVHTPVLPTQCTEGTQAPVTHPP